MLTAAALKKIVAEARPLIEQQLDLAEKVAGLREVVTTNGGDWSQLKALVKAQIQDERDDAGDGKRVRKILDRADYAQTYADMLGLGNMNEESFSDDETIAEFTIHVGGERAEEITSNASNSGALSAETAQEEITPDHDPETGEITEPAKPASSGVAAVETEAPSSVDSGDAPHSVAATIQQGSAEVARGAHNPEVAGSIPAPATSGEAMAATGESPVISGLRASVGGEDVEDGRTGEATANPNASPASAPAIPGSVWTERTPKVGVTRHDYNRAWPERWLFGLHIEEVRKARQA